MRRSRVMALTNRSGVILFIAVWALVILTVLSLGMSRGTRAQLAGARYQLGRMRSRHACYSALAYAIRRIYEDSVSEEGRGIDTRYQLGVVFHPGEGPQQAFRQVALPFGRFDVVRDGEGAPEQGPQYGFSDEESRINLNAVTVQNISVLIELIMGLGYTLEEARLAAASILDWTDRDHDRAEAMPGQEADFYSDRSYGPKNGPFESFAELSLVKGVSPEMLVDLRPYVTVFPRSGRLRLNFNTASEQVLGAVFRTFTGGATRADEGDARSLVQKIVVYRRGPDGREGTGDDQEIRWEELILNARERVLAAAVSAVHTPVSRFIRAEIVGYGDPAQVSTQVRVVIDRESLEVVSWVQGRLTGDHPR